jgi:hypothetical protein
MFPVHCAVSSKSLSISLSVYVVRGFPFFATFQVFTLKNRDRQVVVLLRGQMVPFGSNHKSENFMTGCLLVRFQNLTAPSVPKVFCDIAPCTLIKVDWRLRRAYCVLHQDDYRVWKVGTTSTRLHGATFQKAVIFKAIYICYKYW